MSRSQSTQTKHARIQQKDLTNKFTNAVVQAIEEALDHTGGKRHQKERDGSKGVPCDCGRCICQSSAHPRHCQKVYKDIYERPPAQASVRRCSDGKLRCSYCTLYSQAQARSRKVGAE